MASPFAAWVTSLRGVLALQHTGCRPSPFFRPSKMFGKATFYCVYKSRVLEMHLRLWQLSVYSTLQPIYSEKMRVLKTHRPRSTSTAQRRHCCCYTFSKQRLCQDHFYESASCTAQICYVCQKQKIMLAFHPGPSRLTTSQRASQVIAHSW